MNEEILDLINLNVSAKLMAAWVCVLLLLCTSSAAISCTIHKLILQRAILLISHNALRLGCSHERSIVACIVSSWSTHHYQILSLVLSTTQLRPWSRRWIRHAIPDVLDRFIHIGCSFLATFLWCNNLDSICSGYWSIWMNTAWEKRLIHLFHKRVEQNFSFFAAQDISLILDCSSWGLFLFSKAPFQRSLISWVRRATSTSIHDSLSIWWRFHIVSILWLLLLHPNVRWLTRRCVIILHDNHHHPATLPLRLWLLLLIVLVGAYIYMKELIWISLIFFLLWDLLLLCEFNIESSPLSPSYEEPLEDVVSFYCL